MHWVVPRRHLARIAAVAAGGLAVTAALTSPASASSSPWTVVRTANASTADDDSLSSVAAVSGSDVWAVGSDMNPGVGTKALIENWNGSSWKISADLNLGGSAVLDSVSADSASDIWAVGSSSAANSANSTPIAEHFNGSSWTSVPVPAPAASAELTSVAAISPANVWAVGSVNFATALIEHWNGSSWSVVTAPAPPSGDQEMLSSVTADNANDIWAVGSEAVPSGDAFCNQTLADHWDGTNWSTVPTPASTTTCNSLSSVTAASGTDAWAVGTAGGSALTEHWDGTSWSVVPNPDSAFSTSLGSVVELSPTDVWAVGNGDRVGAGSTLAMQWNGSTWSVVSTPSGSVAGLLGGVAQVPGTSALWAVGFQANNAQTDISQTLALRDTSG
jgi:hypothetical protein